jgi:hypothetical protein
MILLYIAIIMVLGWAGIESARWACNHITVKVEKH